MEARIRKETEKLRRDPPPGVSMRPMSNNFRHFQVVLVGPKGSPYEGGHFKLELFCPTKYPHAPPHVRFLTKVYHPNIDRTGRICLDILKDKWCPAIELDQVCIQLQCLLQNPNPDDPLATDVADHWKLDLNGAMQKAKEWTLRYAR